MTMASDEVSGAECDEVLIRVLYNGRDPHGAPILSHFDREEALLVEIVRAERRLRELTTRERRILAIVRGGGGDDE